MVVTPLCAQDFSGHNWYFGNSNLGIRFSRSDNSPSLISNKTALGTGGSAVATDPVNGNLLFYSDGVNVYDITHTAMTGGSLSGNPAGNQPVAIAQVPGSTTQYYVFSNTASGTAPGTISYAIVDMTLPGNETFPTPPIGNISSSNNVIGGLANRSESMIIIQHENKRDFWLITHENGAPNYSVTLFDNSAIGPVATTNLTIGLIDVAANFSYHPGNGKIAVSPQETNRDIEVLNFDPATGALTYNQRILNTAVASTLPQAIFDTEWSNNGQYLYISRHGDTGVQADVLQFDFLNQTTTLASVLPQPNNIFRSFGLQMAPDSAIYHLYQAVNGGPFLLGSMTNTDTVASEVIYDARAFNSNPDFGAMQFPSFAARDSIEFTVDFISEGTCANSPVSFYPTVVPAADSLIWNFGDGQFANEWSPVHTYDQDGTMTVEVIAFLNGDTAYASRPLNLTAFDLQLTLVQDTTACVCELPVNAPVCPTITPFEVSVQAQGGTAPTYQWFGPGGLLAGQTTETLRPDSAGYYYVVATDGLCSAYAGVNIKEYDSLDQRANIWYFGNGAGIDFNPLPDNPAIPIDGPLNTPEGTSVISDRNGQVIFSTDGHSVYNKLGEDITPTTPPPGGLGGNNTSTQSALIMPVPGDETLYYIFTTQEVYGTGTYELRYSLFDLKLNNGVGGLAEWNQLLFGPSTERITGDANWLIAHEFGNNSFRAYRITATGIGNPVVSSIGSDHAITSQENAQGYMKLGAQNRLVVALSTPGVSNVVEVFDFVDSSGVVTNFRTADLESASGQVYGVEVSPSGSKLYATLRDAAPKMYEFAFDSLGNPYLKQSVNATAELGAIQIGPDGQVYVAKNGSSSLGMFQPAEDTTQLSNIGALQDFDLAGNTSTLGLPNFIQTIANPTGQPGFNFTGLCLGDSTFFTAVGKDPAIDKFDWNFGDGQSAIDSGAQIAHQYALPGTYTVVLTIRNKCETPVATFSQDVVINDVPPDPTNAVVLCTGAADLDANPQDLPDFTYVWSTGDSTETINVNQNGIYTVTVTDALGCSTDGQFFTSDNRPQVELGPNTTICQNTPVTPLDASNPGATYAWQVNGAASGTAQTQNVNTAAFGIFEYKVLVTDPVTNCFVRDSTTFTINESPNITVPPPAPIVCNSNTGQITLNFVSPAGSLFSYFITGITPIAPGADQPSGTSVTASNLDGGLYTITVSDQISGCATATTASINEDALTVTAVPDDTCDPINLDVSVTLNPGPLTGNLSYRIVNFNTGLDEGSGAQPTTSFNTALADGLPSNNQQYVVEVTTIDNCVASSAPVAVNQAATVPATITADPCVDPVILQASAGNSWLWTGPGTITNATSQVATVSGLSQGQHTFDVTVSAAGYCDLDTTITVNVNNDIAATFTQTDACADQVILSAAPAGPYTYRWYRDNLLIPGGQQIIAGLADNGAMYRVDVVNTTTGCVFSSPEEAVEVFGELNFTLSATPPCEGQPFTLTATANQPGVSYEWKLDGQVLSGQTSATLVETRGGMYDVTVSSAGGCSVTQNFNVVPSPVTEGSLPGSGIICPDPANPDQSTREVLLDAGADFTSYNWLRDGSPIGGETSRTFTATQAGTYSVELVNIYGCPSTDETLLIEDCTPRITGPNAFRPTSNVQGSGEYANRAFKLFTFFIDDEGFEVFIFNRWGEMVYHTTERDFRWNGGYNNSAGQPLPTGTYTYVVRYKRSYRPEEGIKEKRGGVVLIR